MVSVSLCVALLSLSLPSADEPLPAAEPIALEGAAPESFGGPYVSFNLGIELHAIERAASEVAQATQELSAAVRTMAANPSLSDEHKAQMLKVIGRIDGLSGNVVQAIDRLPVAVEESGEPLLAMVEGLAKEARWVILGIVLGLIAIIVVVLWATYALILRPIRNMMGDTTGGFKTMAMSLEKTTELVAQTNAAQLELTRALESLKSSMG